MGAGRGSRTAEPEDEPYYPVSTPTDRKRLSAYRELAAAEPEVFFGGRLGTYKYLDMHAAIASAMALVKNQLAPLFREDAKTGGDSTTIDSSKP